MSFTWPANGTSIKFAKIFPDGPAEFSVARIDLNCDLGEGAAAEAELMPLVTSANIACGGHAGDAASMRVSVALALRHNVAIGAHPSFPDREHFGRRERSTTAGEVFALVRTQARALEKITHAQHARLRHVKAHGALYNQSARDPVLAAALLDAVAELGLILFAPAGSVLLIMARERTIPVASEVFADRTYQANGSLTPRTRSGAVITQVEAAVAQAVRLIQERRVRSLEGVELKLSAETMCVHGDGPDALILLRALRREFDRAGIQVRAFEP
jgi:UPF0271 protein